MNLVVVLRRVLHFATYANNLCRFDNMLKHNWIFYNVNSVAIRLLSKQPCKSLWYFYVCYTDDHIMSKKRKSTTRDEVEWRDCCSLHAVTRLLWSFTVHTNGKCYLFVLYNKNWNGLSKDLGARKKKNESADAIWRGGFVVICVCVSFNKSRSTTNESTHGSHVIV